MSEPTIVVRQDPRGWASDPTQRVLLLSERHYIYRGRLSRKGGSRMLPDGMSCARPGRWGNSTMADGALDAMDCQLLFHGDLTNKRWDGTLSDYLAPLVERWRKQCSITLYCHCPLDAPCHCTPLADALVAELERLESAP